MFAIGVAAFALGFSIVAIVVSAGAVYYSASQARSYKKIEANDSERRAEEVANRKVADVHWVASFRRSADTNEFGFDDTVNLVVTNKGPRDADDVAFEVPTVGLRYDMTRTGFGVIHAGESRTITMRMDPASVSGMGPLIQLHWHDGRNGRQTYERHLTPDEGYG